MSASTTANDIASKIEQFAAILAARVETASHETILAKIETNTAILRKLKPGVIPAVTVDRARRTGPGSSDLHDRTKRDSLGRFVATAKGEFPRSRPLFSEREHPAPTRETDQDGKTGIISKAIDAVKVNEDAIMHAAGGPFFEAAMELKGALDSVRGLGKKAGILSPKPATDARIVDKADGSGESSDKIITALMKSEKSDEERHTELIKAILQSGKPGTSSAGLPSVKRTGPGSTAREKLRKAMNKPQVPVGIATRTSKFPGKGGGGSLSSLGAGAGILAAGGAAAYALSQVAQAITTGRSDINDAFKKLTGIDMGKRTQGDVSDENQRVRENTARINAERRAQGKKELEFDPLTGMVKPGAVATASESGKGGAGTISTGKNDAGGASYGKKQLASAGGDKSPVAQFVKQSSHAKEFEGLTPGTPAFDQKWKDVAARDKNFGAEQDQYVAKTMSAPVIARAVKGGFNTEDVGIRESLISQSVNHGPGGNKKILEGAQASLATKYGSVDAAPVQDQIDALTASRKNYVNQVAVGKMTKAQKLRAQGNEKGAQKAEGEAKQLRSMAGAGGRYDQENAISKELSATGGIVGKTATAQKSKAVEPIVEGEASREKAASAVATETPLAPILTATATPVTDVRKRILDKKRAGLAAMGAGSLEVKPIEGSTTAIAKTQAVEKPVPMADAIATQVPGRIKQPERIESLAAKGLVDIGGSKSAGPEFSIPGLDKMIAALGKLTDGKEEKSKGDVQQIRTEFDDTMLTLMAYDRV